MSAAPRWIFRPAVLWLAFVLVHAWLLWLSGIVVPEALGDVTGIYHFWVLGGLSGRYLVGVTTPWVYPVLALIPLFAPVLAGANNYLWGWLGMVTILDAIGFGVLIHWWRPRAPRARAAWWWMGALVALGPIAVGRLDTPVTPLAICALLFVLTRPMLAGALMAVGAWIKVWPAAILLAAIALVRRRLALLFGAVAVTLVVVIVDLALGGGANILSFIGFQSNRGLQIESPAATPFLWLATNPTSGLEVFFDDDILTFEVRGPGVAAAATVVSVLMILGVLAVCVLLWLRLRDAQRDGLRVVQYLPAATLAFVMVLIAFNKVGSPQYFTWLIAPIVAGLVIDRSRFAAISALGLVGCVLTQMIYPWVYNDILTLNPIALVALSARNVLELVLLGMSLWLLGRRREQSRELRPDHV